jgi:hypothetical protein
MKGLNATLMACAALALACGASAEEKVKLEYKLKPGTELIYKVSGTLKGGKPGDQRQMEATVAGSERFVVAEVDEKTGALLIGQAPDLKLAQKMIGGNGGREHAESFDTVSVCRMDRAGNLVPRKLKDADNPRPAVIRFRLAMDRLELDPAALPAGEVAIGATWESATDSVLRGIPAPSPAKLASTLAEIKIVDGHKCALIKSKVSPSDKAANARVGGPELEVTGDVETLFDLEGGFSRSVNTKLQIQVNGAGGEQIEAETSTTLDSVKALPAEEAARTVKLIRALDAAAANVADGEYDKATDALEKLKEADPPEPWKAGIEKTTANIHRMTRGRPGLPPVPAPAVPAEQLFAEGQKAMDDQNWTEAVAKFKELAEKYPTHALTGDALTAAIGICENRLNDQKTADDLRKKAAALKENK